MTIYDAAIEPFWIEMDEDTGDYTFRKYINREKNIISRSVPYEKISDCLYNVFKCKLLHQDEPLTIHSLSGYLTELKKIKSTVDGFADSFEQRGA